MPLALGCKLIGTTIVGVCKSRRYESDASLVWLLHLDIVISGELLQNCRVSRNSDHQSVPSAYRVSSVLHQQRSVCLTEQEKSFDKGILLTQPAGHLLPCQRRILLDFPSLFVYVLDCCCHVLRLASTSFRKLLSGLFRVYLCVAFFFF